MKRQLTTLFVASAMLLAFTAPSMAAIEIDEEDFGPSYDTMIVDTVVGKPLQLVAAVAGTAAYAISYPFAHFGGNLEESERKLVTEPWNALNRCLGCTVAEDNFYKAQVIDENIVRIVVDKPSEILINTDDNVIVLPQ